MKKAMLFSIILVTVLAGAPLTGYSATKTWTGTTSSDWQVATNWSGGVPGAADVARFTNTGINRNITNVPTTTLRQIIVTTTGPDVSYSFSSAGPVTITLATGSTGIDLWVVSGCELILNPSVTLTITGALTSAIAGNLVVESALNINTTGNFLVNGTVHMNGTLAVNNNRTVTGTGSWFVDATKTMTVSSAGARFVLQTSIIENNGTLSVAANSEFRAEPGSSLTGSPTSAVNLASGGTLRTTGNCQAANLTGATGSVVRVSGGTLTLTGTSSVSGILAVIAGTTLVCDGSLALNTNSTIVHNGTITVNAGRTMVTAVSFTSGNNTSMNVNGTFTLNAGVTWSMNSPGAACTISATGNIAGAGNMDHTSGTQVINGLVTLGGNFSNAGPITGTGTIEIGGSFTNTSTMFSYPGVPPGKIISGYTWRGLNGTAWETAANWWAGAVPVASGDVVIYATTNQPVVSGPLQTCRRLYIHNDAAVVTISPSGQLTATGKTTLGGGGGTSGNIKLVIKSVAAGTGSFIDNGVFEGEGKVTMERFLAYGSSGMWHYICIPMTQINAFTYFDQYMKYYDEPTHHFKYVIAPSDSLLNSDGLAYAMWPQYADWTAVQSGIPNTGSVDIPVTRTFDPLTGDYDGWNLVGNPFTSAVDLSLILLAGLSTNLDPTAWFWDPQSGNYTVFPLGGGGSHSQYCPAGQGFFIHCSDLNATPASPGSGNVHMVSSARLHNTESFLKETKANILKVTVTGSPNAFRDEMSIYFDDARTSEYEPGFDAEKIEGSPEAPQLWSVSENIDLAVNALSFTGQTMIVPVWFKAGHPGSYRLLFSELESFNQSTGIYLEDLAEGIIRDLRADPEYIFSHSLGNPPERFAVRFTKESIGIPVPDQGQSLRIFAAGGRITIESPSAAGLHGRIDIYDLLGRSVSSVTAGGQPRIDLDAPVSTGYLVVRVVEPERTTVRKIYMK